MNKILLFIYFFSYSLLAKSQTADFTYTTSSGLFCNPSTVQFTQTVREPLPALYGFLEMVQEVINQIQ